MSRRHRAPRRAPKCPVCGKDAVLTPASRLYPHRPDLFEKSMWICTPCDTRVGCHPGTTQPLGVLATAAERKARSRAHAAFDPLWKTGAMSRAAAYRWLAAELGLSVDNTHIALFDVTQCEAVVSAVRLLRSRAGVIEA